MRAARDGRDVQRSLNELSAAQDKGIAARDACAIHRATASQLSSMAQLTIAGGDA
jgi:hypothetical protein